VNGKGDAAEGYLLSTSAVVFDQADQLEARP
jgi:hypothetical protein